jgi:cell division septation protein DedD
MAQAESTLYKEKIDISLDGRQVFYLFFGGSLVVCLVFVLGVMIGRRVESRAHVGRVDTSAARDPLSALDRLAADERATLSFRSALGSGEAKGSAVAAAAEKVAQTQAALAPAKPEAPAAVAPAVAKVVEGPVVAPTVAKSVSAPVAAPPVAEKAKITVAAKPVEPASAPAAGPAIKDSKTSAEPAGKSKFTLQLSAFQDRAEAQAFLDQIHKAGYSAYLAEASVDGKGTFYRVRLGSYNSYDAAVAGKDEFERKVHKIAYVTKI